MLLRSYSSRETQCRERFVFLLKVCILTWGCEREKKEVRKREKGGDVVREEAETKVCIVDREGEREGEREEGDRIREENNQTKRER